MFNPWFKAILNLVKQMRKSKRIVKERKKLLAITKWYWECMVKVNDDWHPNYPKNEIKVSVTNLWFLYHGSRGLLDTSNFSNDIDGHCIRIFATGQDDFYLEKDYPVDNLETSIRVFEECCKYVEGLKILEPINQDFLMSEGF